MATMTAAVDPMASAWGRQLSHLQWAHYPSVEARAVRTAPARRGFEARFYAQAREMHPDASEGEIEYCVEHLRKAYYSELARKRWEKNPPKTSSSGSGKKSGGKKGRTAA